MRGVLIIPSWYGSAQLPMAGSFFKDQASLACEHYDVRLLLVRRTVYGRRTPHRWIVPRLWGPQLASFKTRADSDGLVVHHAEFDVAGRWVPVDEVALAAEARQILGHSVMAGWRPELIHCHGATPAGCLGAALAAQLHVPLVVTEHQHIIRDYYPADEWPAAKRVYERASKVAAVSTFQRQMMLMNGAPCDPVVIGNLVDDVVFRCVPPSIEQNGIRILFVGLASPLKDYPTFIRALRCLRGLTSDSIEVKVVCADVPSAQREVSAQFHSLCADISVQFLGSVSRAGMAELCGWSTVVVSTSVAETFGVSVCEALACGRPVVTTASGGVSDFVRDGWNGFIVPIGAAELVAQRICDVAAGRLTASSREQRAAVVASYGRVAFFAKLGELYGPP